MIRTSESFFIMNGAIINAFFLILNIFELICFITSIAAHERS